MGRKGKKKNKNRKQPAPLSDTQAQTQVEERSEEHSDDVQTNVAEVSPIEQTTEEHSDDVQTNVAGVSSSEQTTEGATETPEDLCSPLRQSVVSPELPRRPGFGVLGRPIRLIANCFPVKLPCGLVYHYDVNIIKVKKGSKLDLDQVESSHKKYRALSRRLNRKIVNLMLETCRPFKNAFAAFDGEKNLYTREPLAIKSRTKFLVVLPDEAGRADGGSRRRPPDEFEVYVKPVEKKEGAGCGISLDNVHALYDGKVSYVPQEAIMAMDTVLRHGPSLKFTPIGQSFFFPPEKLHPLSGGVEIWFGYHQSLRLGQWKPLLNADTSSTVFYTKGPVLRHFCEVLGKSELVLQKTTYLLDPEILKLTKHLRECRIQVTHSSSLYKRKYCVVKVTKESARNLRLRKDDGTEGDTVEEYFRQKYKKKLMYPNLPCLQVKPEEKHRYIPVEFCEVLEGQHYKPELTDEQKAEMIRFTVCPPDKRFQNIDRMIKKADFEHDECVRHFDIKVCPEPLKLQGRVLEAPGIVYESNAIVKPRDGSWTMRDKKFYVRSEVKSWVVLSYSDPTKYPHCGRKELQNFANMLCRLGQDSGIKINPTKYIEMAAEEAWSVGDKLDSLKRKFKADLVVVVIPFKSKDVYGKVKEFSEIILGLTTQCVKDINIVQKCVPNLITNICQKINAKKGGINSVLIPHVTPKLFQKPAIVIGADVSHPAAYAGTEPSIASVVGSINRFASRYAVSIRAQKHSVEKKKALETIVYLKGMVVGLLKAFYGHTRLKPEKIIFFRDGVSEGQLTEVHDKEVRAIREACQSLSPDYQPGITFIVVQKRHHVRFKPEDPRDSVGKTQNVPPGTTVDTDVTHPLYNDYFLCSHFGLQGTSRPAHYVVIEDDNNFKADELHKLTYHLCHIYSRCTKSISIPVPVQYAHLVAYRARQHYLTKKGDTASSSSSGQSGSDAFSMSEVDSTIRVVDELKDSMYYV